MNAMRGTLSTLAAAAMLCFAAQPAAAQSGPLALSESRIGGAPVTESRADWTDAAAKYEVVIDLDENRLHFRQGGTTLWSAPVGTGTGLRLEAGDREWDFSTPNGTFEVKFKEVDPVWRAPDWFYIENDLPIPPQDSPKRLFPGGLGAAAVYIDAELAIHGTDKPELLGQRVSHGCIRMSDKDAMRLFHNVQVGTKVRIIGGADVPAPVASEAGSASTFTPDKPKQPEADPILERWQRMSTPELLAELDLELWADDEISRWTELGSMLLQRGLEEGEDAALAGLMTRLGDLPSRRVEREYATYLADAYARHALRTLKVMSRLQPAERQRAARAVVAATLGLYPGMLTEPTAPWPTRRVPRALVERDMRRGWEALAEAERELRRTAA